MWGGWPIISAMVARPVNRKELKETPAAQAATQAEWDGHIKRGTWDMNNAKPLSWVIKDTTQRKDKLHLARILGFCVERNSELDKETSEGNSKDVLFTTEDR